MTFSDRARRLALGAAAVLSTAFVAVPAIAAEQAVSIVDKSFQPATITVAAGDKVTWTVTKSIGEPHSVTSGKLGDADSGKQFDSGIKLKDDGQSFSFTFDTPGTYDYFCSVHAEMKGVVTVLAAGASGGASEAPPSAPPSPSPAATAAGSQAPAGSPGASGSPGPSAAPEPGEPVPPENRAIAAGVLIVALALLFAASAAWRRLNRA
jgi:plastocyanin